MHIYFGLGSNMGDRLGNLRSAITKLQTLGRLERVSSVYETSAWGGVPQPDYLNACVKVKAHEDIAPLEVLRTVKEFERELGRVPSVRWGERSIDIDILLMDDMIFHSGELDVPHVSMCLRKFVLVPLSEIVPGDWRHPVNGRGINELLDTLNDDGEITRIDALPYDALKL